MEWVDAGNENEWLDAGSVDKPLAPSEKKRGFVTEIRQEMNVDRAEVDRFTKRNERGAERTRGERFADSARESAMSSPLGMEAIYRVVQRIKGRSPDQINATERAILDYYGKKRKTDPADDWVDTGLDFSGAMLGSVDPTMALAPGVGVAAKVLSQGAINAGADAVGQVVGMERGVRDEYSPEQTAINATAGVVFEGANQGIRSAVTGHRIRRGQKMPDWQAVNDVIVRDLEGGGTLQNPKVSPKGAMGPQQVMPETARNPGFGIRPWDGKSQEDLARVGRQYSAAMMSKYDGDTEKVLAAYNAGPGRVDGLIRKHGDDWRNHLPKETQNYVTKGLAKLGHREGVPPMDPRLMRQAMNDPEAGALDPDTLDAPGLDGDVPPVREETGVPIVSREDAEAMGPREMMEQGDFRPDDPNVTDIDDFRYQKQADEEIFQYLKMIDEMNGKLDDIDLAIERGMDGSQYLPGIRQRHDDLMDILDDSDMPPVVRQGVEAFLKRSQDLSLKIGGPQLGVRSSVDTGAFYGPRDVPTAANDGLGGLPPGGPPRGPGEPPRGPGGDPPENPSADPWAGSVNLNRLDISERAKQHLRTLAARTDARGVETHAETSEAANRLIDEHGIEGVLGMDDADIENLPALSVATRAILEATNENVVRLADEIIDPSRATPLASHKFEHALLLAATAFEKANRNANIAGRLLQAFRIMGKDGDPTAFATVRRDMGADASIYDIALKIKENQAHAAQIAADGLQPGALDKFSSLWYNWKLSGLTTQAANLVGTLAHFGLDMSSRVVGVGVGAVRGGPDRAHLGEVWARTVGLYSGLKQAFSEVELDGGPYDGKTTRPIYEAWRIGMPLDFVNKTRSGRAFHGPASAILEGPTRGMAVVDEVMRNIAVVSDMNGQAWRIAKDEGLTGDAFKARVIELIERPTRKMQEAAMEYGKRMRFADDASMLTTRLEQARRISKDDRIGDKVMAIFSRMVVPFMHTLDRLTAASVSHSPLGFMNSRNQKDLVKGGPDMDLANGRMLVGTALVAYAAMKAFSGDITGADDNDFREIEANRAEGKGSYNIRIGERWASMKQLQPVSTLLGATASVVEAYKKNQDDKLFTQFFDISRRMGDAVLSGAWTESLNNFFGGSKSSPESRWANWAAGALDPVPSIARQTWQTFGDRQERDTTGDRSFEDRVINRWKAGTPLSTTLPQKHDIYGRELDRGDAIGPDIASPLKAHKADTNFVVQEISRLNKETGKTTIGRVRREKGMSSEEFQSLQKETGELFMQGMDELVSRPGWDDMTTELQVKLTKKVWSKASKAVRKQKANEWTDVSNDADEWVDSGNVDEWR